MATNYNDLLVECPFFRRSSESDIVCEGFDKTQENVMKFRRKDKAQKYKEKYCKCKYKQCKMYIALDNSYTTND